MGNEKGKSSRCKLPPLTKTNTKIHIMLNTLLKSMPLKTKNNTNKNTTTKSKYIGSSKKRVSSMYCNDSKTQFQGGPLGRTASLKKK